MRKWWPTSECGSTRISYTGVIMSCHAKYLGNAGPMGGKPLHRGLVTAQTQQMNANQPGKCGGRKREGVPKVLSKMVFTSTKMRRNTQADEIESDLLPDSADLVVRFVISSWKFALFPVWNHRKRALQCNHRHTTGHEA